MADNDTEDRPQVVRFGDLQVDFGARRVSLAGAPVALTKSEFRLLGMLASNPDRAIADRDLLSWMFQSPWQGSTSPLQVHISRLRRKLGESGRQPRYVRTVLGFGYRFDPAPPVPAVAPTLGAADLAAMAASAEGGDLVAYALLDGNRTLQWVSESITGLLGWHAEDLVGVVVYDLAPPEERSQWAASRSSLDGGSPLSTQGRVRAIDGSYRLVRATVRPLLTSDGGVTGFLVEFRALDAVAQRPDPAEIRPISLDATTDASLLGLLADSTDVLLVLDPDGTYLWASPSALGMLGLPPEQLIGTRHRLVHPADEGQALARIQAAIGRGEQGVRGRLRVVTADGAVRWVDSSTRIQWRDGRLFRYLVSLRDIDEEVAAAERLRLVAENASDIVVLTGPDGLAQWISPAIEACLGWKAQQLLGTSFLDLMHPDDTAWAGQARAWLLAGGLTEAPGIPPAARFRAADGTYRWMTGRARPITDAAGQANGVVFGLSLVDELVHARERAQADEERLRATLDSMLDPHVVLAAVRDESGRIVDFEYVEANGAACAYNQTSREDLIGSTLLGLLPAHADTGLLDRYIDVVETGRPLVLDGFEYPHEILSEPRRFDVRAVKVGDSLSYTWRDVTARMNAESALRESEARYRLIAEHSGDVVVAADPAGILTYVSPAVTATLGWEPKDLVGSAVRTLIHPDDLPAVADEMTRMQSGDERPGTMRARVRCLDGTYRWMASVARTVLDDTGAPAGKVATWRDIQAEASAETPGAPVPDP